MIRNFFSTPNVIGKLMIALLFVGGVVFAGAFNGFVVEIEASSCCGATTCGGTDIFSSSSCCNCEQGSTCSPCGSDDACDGRRKGCSSKCNYPDKCHECKNVCGGPTSGDLIKCSGGTNGCCTEDVGL